MEGVDAALDEAMEILDAVFVKPHADKPTHVWMELAERHRNLACLLTRENPPLDPELKKIRDQIWGASAWLKPLPDEN